MAVTKEAVETELKAIFSQLNVDSSNDGENPVLGLGELRHAFGMDAANEYLQYCDMNKDGVITQEEFVNGIWNKVSADNLTEEQFKENWSSRMHALIAEKK